MKTLTLLPLLFLFTANAQVVENAEGQTILHADPTVFLKGGFTGYYIYDQLQENSLLGTVRFNNKGKMISQHMVRAFEEDDTVDFYTLFFYDEKDNLVMERYQKYSRKEKDTSINETTQYIYENGRIASAEITSEEGKNRTYSYDKTSGKLIQVTESGAEDNVALNKFTYTYDTKGRVLEMKKWSAVDGKFDMKSPAGVIKYLYDKEGRLAGINGTWGVYKYATTLEYENGLISKQHGKYPVAGAFYYNYKFCKECD